MIECPLNKIGWKRDSQLKSCQQCLFQRADNKSHHVMLEAPAAANAQ
jgi:hypothetical protein